MRLPLLAGALLVLPATVFAQIGRPTPEQMQQQQRVEQQRQQQIQQQLQQQGIVNPNRQQQQQPGAANNGDAQVRAAEDELKKATANLGAITNTLKKDFENSKEWQDAQGELKTTQAEYDNLKKPILEKIRSTPEYVQAKANKDKAEQDRDALMRDGGSQEQISAAATVVMSSGGVLSKMENEALSADASVANAHNKLVAASTRIGELNKEFEKSIKENQQIVGARASVDAAKTRVEQARAQAAAIKAQQQQQLEAQRRAQQQQYQQQQQQIQQQQRR